MNKQMIVDEMARRHGNKEPFEKNGTVFKQVGCNATHDFYLGIKDDRYWLMTMGFDGRGGVALDLFEIDYVPNNSFIGDL